MLGSDRFAFETPNVIDPGDAPPSAPRRVSLERDDIANGTTTTTTTRTTSAYTAADKASSNRRNSSYKQQRANRLLRDIQDLELSPSQEEEEEAAAADGIMKIKRNEIYDPYDDDDDDDDEEKNNHHHHHPDSARVFAATLLSANANGRGKSSHKETIALTRTVQLDAPSSSPHRRHRHRYVYCHHKRFLAFWSSSSNHHRRLAALLLVLLLVVVVITVTVVTKNNNNNNNPASKGPPYDLFSSQSQRHSHIVQFLIDNHVSSRDDLTLTDNSNSNSNAPTPQQMAAAWIADEDPLQVEPPHNLFADFHFIQRYVLAVLYFAWQGNSKGSSSWKTQANFLTLQHECAWFTTAEFDHFIGQEYAVGVTCDTQNLQVKDLYLPAVGLRGSIPTELQHLSKLQLLSLADNALTGSLPAVLNKLSHLVFLDTKYNHLTGQLPDWIGDNLTQLEVLGLSNNMLSGSVPASWSTLGRLKTLAIDDNAITGSIDFLNPLTNLEYLYADRNQLSGVLTADSLGSLLRLRELDISSNQLRGNELPALFFNHPSLHVIDLANNQLTATLPPAAATTTTTTTHVNTELDFLSLRGNQMQGSIPESIGSFVTLKHLDLQDNRFTGSIPLTLIKLTELEYLSVGYNDFFPAELPPSLVALSGLKELSLPSIQLTGSIPNWEAQFLPNLQYVDLSYNQLRSTIPDTLWSLSNLEYLLLQDNQLTGSVPSSTATNFQVLALHRNIGLTGDVSAVCQTPLTDSETDRIVATDCTLTCDSDCCPKCCSPREETCSLDQDLENRLTASEGLWEFGYQRTPFAFDPDMLDEVGAFKIIYQERSP